MQLDKFIIALIIISAVTITMGGFMVELSTNYNIPVNDRYSATFSKFNESSQMAEDITASFKTGSASEGSGSEADLEKVYKAALSIIKVTFFQGIPAAFSLITNMGQFIPIPAYILTSLQAILLVMFLFAGFYLYLRYKN